MLNGNSCVNGGSNGGRVAWTGEDLFGAQVEPMLWQQISGIRPWSGFGF